VAVEVKAAAEVKAVAEVKAAAEAGIPNNLKEANRVKKWQKNKLTI